MGGIVSSPCDEIILQFILIVCYILKHVLHCDIRDITLVVSPFTCNFSCFLYQFGFRAIITAANRKVAFSWRPFFIFEIDMNVRKLNWSDCFPFTLSFSYFFVNIIKVSIILYIFRFFWNFMLNVFFSTQLFNGRAITQMEVFIAYSVWRQETISNSRKKLVSHYCNSTCTNWFFTSFNFKCLTNCYSSIN